MLRHLLAILALLASPIAAGAQDCPPVSVVQLYREAQASGRDYRILRGHVGVSTPLRAEGPQLAPYATILNGHALTPAGFTSEWSNSLQIIHVCTPEGPPCGDLPIGADVLVFAADSPDPTGTAQAIVGPCGRWVRAFPTPAEIAALTACAQGACP